MDAVGGVPIVRLNIDSSRRGEFREKGRFTRQRTRCPRWLGRLSTTLARSDKCARRIGLEAPFGKGHIDSAGFRGPCVLSSPSSGETPALARWFDEREPDSEFAGILDGIRETGRKGLRLGQGAPANLHEHHGVWRMEWGTNPFGAD